MDLLPKHKSEFSTLLFWEKFFKLRGSKSFEWYGNYTTFCNYICRYIRQFEKILVIGCGNSELSSSMYDVGYKNILNIDNNSFIIQKMTKKFLLIKPELKFSEMDVTDLKINENDYSVVLDKGTLDAIFSEDSEDCRNCVSKMFAEIERILKFGGRYFCITLAQPYIAQYTLQFFFNLGWMVRVCRVQSDFNNDSNSFHLPVFIFIFTKFKKISEGHDIIEICFFENKIERLSSINELLNAIDDVQKYAIIKDQLKNGMLLTEQLCLDICDDTSKWPRYQIYVVDGKISLKKFAIFIVPQGRELEWMFCTDAGRMDLYDHCGFQRLLIVTLNRSHKFKDLEQVKKELSSMVLELAPSKVQKQSPFLTLGDTINVKKVVHEGSTSMSGEFVVEDLEINKEMQRRIIFLNNPNLVQSEAKLVKVKKKKSKYICSHLHLSSVYHLAFISSITFCSNFHLILDSKIQLLLVGLGAGNIAMFFKQTLQMVSIDCIEIDEDIIKIAKDFFGFECDEKVACLCGDGVKLIKELALKEKLYDVIFIDVDNKDVSQGLSCPPQQFIETNFLENCLKLTQKSGLLVFNVACRNKDIYEMIISKLKSFFTSIYCLKFPREINEIIFCISYQNDIKKVNLQDEALKKPKMIESFKDELEEKWKKLISKMKLNDSILLKSLTTFNFNDLQLL